MKPARPAVLGRRGSRSSSVAYCSKRVVRIVVVGDSRKLVVGGLCFGLCRGPGRVVLVQIGCLDEVVVGREDDLAVVDLALLVLAIVRGQALDEDHRDTRLLGRARRAPRWSPCREFRRRRLRSAAGRARRPRARSRTDPRADRPPRRLRRSRSRGRCDRCRHRHARSPSCRLASRSHSALGELRVVDGHDADADRGRRRWARWGRCCIRGRRRRSRLRLQFGERLLRLEQGVAPLSRSRADLLVGCLGLDRDHVSSGAARRRLPPRSVTARHRRP